MMDLHTRSSRAKALRFERARLAERFHQDLGLAICGLVGFKSAYGKRVLIGLFESADALEKAVALGGKGKDALSSVFLRFVTSEVDEPGSDALSLV